MSLRAIIFLFLGLSSLAAQELITPTAISSASAGTDYFAAQNLINGSGLSGTATIANYAGLTHTTASGTNAWVTTDPGTDYYATAAAPPVLTLSLNDVHDLTDFVLWGYHFGSPNNNEAKSFTLEFSTDSGLTFANPVQLDHARTASMADTLSLGTTIAADTVRITITDNHYGNPGAGGGDRVGIGEIRFIGALQPNTSPVLTVSPNIDFGSHATDPGLLQTSLTLNNSGTGDALLISSVAVRDGSTFTVSGAPTSIAAGESATLTVDFDAGGIDGCYFAFLDINSNDPESPLTAVVLTGSVNCIPPTPEAPVFSLPSQTFSDSAMLSLTTPTAGGYIVFTTDGSLPSAENGTAYDSPLTLTATTQIRAATIVPGLEPAVASESYVRLAPDMQAYQSELPIMIVENFSAGPIPNKGWSVNSQTGAGLIQPDRQPSVMFIFDRDPQSNTAAVASLPDVDSRMGIRVRGAFSSTWTPKPYSIETWKKDSNDDRNIAPLGMPSDSDWILYFPHPNYDTTMLNNTFIWELGSRTGRYGTRFRFVDVFVNENGGDLTLADRKGVYALAEKVKRDAQRIDFDALSDDGSTGGWLLSINRMDAIPASGFPTENGATSPQFFHTPGPNRILQTAPNAAGSGDDIPRQYNAFINFENPNGYAINVAQRAAIENWHTDFENVFYDNDTWLDPENGYRQYLDTRDFIDYFHLLNLGKQGDGLLLSIYPWVSSGERKLRMGPMWDFNNGAFSGSTTDTLYFRQDRLWYPRLFADPAYLREHIDRWYALRRGPLSNLSMTSLIDEQAAGIPDSLVPGQGVALTTWRNRVTSMKSWVTARANWIDSQWLAPPALSLDANVLTISHPTAGSLYYTTDGSDPLDSATAILYQAPVPLSQSVNVRTRLLAGSEWSALNEDTYRIGTPASSSNLVISEIMYNPAIGTEFIELQNISTTETVDLTGVRFITGINYDFQVGTTLTPGQRIVITEAEFLNATRLANGGEQLVLSGENDTIIRDFTYDDRPPWPEAADGDGYSLILISPESNPDHGTATNWRSSADLGGNPGTSDAIPYVPGTPLLPYALTDVNAFSVSINESGIPEFSLPVNVAADQAIVTIEQSTDLINWTPLGEPTDATFYRLRVTLR